MYIQRMNNGKRVPIYHCGNYPKVPVGTLCQSAHRIKADHVMEIVVKTIKEVIQYANLDKECFAGEIQSHIEDRQTVDFTEQKKRMAVCEKRIGEYIPPTMAEKEPTPEELEEMRKKEARKDRLHQNYLRRKARN